MPVFFLSATLCTAQKLPTFEQFAETDTLTGTPAPPMLKTPSQRSFRTMIREGTAKGPNFAGHYTIVTWGCGSSCVSEVVVDAKTGKVHSLPFSYIGFGVPIEFADGVKSMSDSFQPLLFKLNSRLLIVRGCPKDRDCATYYYEWAGESFTLIQKSRNKRTPGAGSMK
jgi:hypothetical protein